MKFLIIILLTFSFNLKSDTNLNEHEDIIKKTLSNTMLSLKNSLEKALESGDVEYDNDKKDEPENSDNEDSSKMEEVD